ncbi:MAG: LapA family protein [Brachymonas sp.]|nr:LapA family protein [Brachymonas sp.]
MKYLSWLLKAAIFFILFVFAVGNRHMAALYVWPGTALEVPVMIIVLASFALGSLLGILVMLPRWWRYKRAAQLAEQRAQQATAAAPAAEQAANPAPAELERHMTDPSLPITPSDP